MNHDDPRNCFERCRRLKCGSPRFAMSPKIRIPRLPEPSIDALTHCLGASRKVIQRRAAEALAASAAHDARVVEKLRAMLSHHDPRARWGAVYALGLVSIR